MSVNIPISRKETAIQITKQLNNIIQYLTIRNTVKINNKVGNNHAVAKPNLTVLTIQPHRHRTHECVSCFHCPSPTEANCQQYWRAFSLVLVRQCSSEPAHALCASRLRIKQRHHNQQIWGLAEAHHSPQIFPHQMVMGFQ